MPAKASIVFAHGLWADGSCFSKVIPAASGGRAPGGGRPEQPRHARRRRRRGHPRAGPGQPARPFSSATPTAAPSSRPRAPTTASPGWSTSPPSPRTRTRRRRACRSSSRSPTSSPTSRSRTGASGCSRQASGASRATCRSRSSSWSGPTQGVPAADLFNQKLPGTAWRTKPSWYIVANNDRTVQPDLERFVAKRMGAHTYDLDSSHVAMLSQPDAVLDIIRTAANSI